MLSQEDVEELIFSPSYPTLTTRYIIHVARVCVQDLPTEELFKRGKTDFTWVDPHLVDDIQQSAFQKQKDEYTKMLARQGGVGNYAKETEQLRKSTSAYVWNALVKTARDSSCSCGASSAVHTHGDGTGRQRSASPQQKRAAHGAGSRAPPVWTESTLKKWLTMHGVRVSKYGHSGAKSIKKLLVELQIGDSALTEDDDGNPLRIVQVAKATVQHADGVRVLVETHQKLESGVMRVRYKTLAEKMQPGESSWVGTQRGIMEELKECLKLQPDFPRTDDAQGHAAEDGDGIFGGKTREPVVILQRTFVDWTLCFSQLPPWIFIPAYCFAIPWQGRGGPPRMGGPPHCARQYPPANCREKRKHQLS